MNPRFAAAAGLVATLACANAAAGWVNPPVIVPLPPRDVCGGFADGWSQHCRRDANGNMIDTRTGDVYDRSGRLIRRGAAPPAPAAPAARACSDGGSTPISLQQRATALHQSGQWQSAAACYERALQVWPAEPTLHVNLGLIDYEQGRQGLAVQRWQDALERLEGLPPDTPNARAVRAEATFAIAVAASARGDMPRAREMAREALRMEPRLGDAGHLRTNLWGARLVGDARALTATR
jgi:tetratricopeptide (TPR) repeat protein